MSNPPKEAPLTQEEEQQQKSWNNFFDNLQEAIMECCDTKKPCKLLIQLESHSVNIEIYSEKGDMDALAQMVAKTVADKKQGSPH